MRGFGEIVKDALGTFLFLSEKYTIDSQLIYSFESEDTLDGYLKLSTSHFEMRIFEDFHGGIVKRCYFKNNGTTTLIQKTDLFLGIPRFYKSTLYFNSYSSDRNEYKRKQLNYYKVLLEDFYLELFAGKYSFEDYKNWEL